MRWLKRLEEGGLERPTLPLQPLGLSLLGFFRRAEVLPYIMQGQNDARQPVSSG